MPIEKVEWEKFAILILNQILIKFTQLKLVDAIPFISRARQNTYHISYSN